MSGSAERSRFVSDSGVDDEVIPFAVEPLDVRGRLVRLGELVDQVLAPHNYPPEVARLTGEATALTALLGSALKFEGRFQLQTKSDGIVDMLVVDFDAPDRVRALAHFNREALEAARAVGPVTSSDLLGRGHLAFTIDRGSHQSRYQGIVALEGQGLEEAAHQYFRQSEQIPTFVRLAVGEMMSGQGARSQWRAGGLMIQFLPTSPARQRMADFDPGDAPEGVETPKFEEDEAWTEAHSLAATVEDHELIDPTLSGERLLYRLYHERGVKVFATQPVRYACRCTREGIQSMLRRFTPQERTDMVGEDGLIGVTCEFCNTKREFDPKDFDQQDGDQQDAEQQAIDPQEPKQEPKQEPSQKAP